MHQTHTLSGLPSFLLRRLLPFGIAIGLALLLVWLMGIGGQPAQATAPAAPAPAPMMQLGASRYISTTGSDSNNCATRFSACRTLQRAVEQANDGDLIRIAGGLYVGTSNVGGTRQIARINKSVTIEGGYNPLNFEGTPNPALFPVTFDASNTGRVFVIADDAAVTVRGLTILNGNGTQGGGSGNGGAILVSSGSLTLTGIPLTGHRATNGGALAAEGGSATLINSEISNNQATGHGGAIYVDSGSATVNGAPITTNKAAEDGGALFVAGGTATFNNVTLANNSAGRDGGAVAMSGGQARLINAQVEVNEAATGRGIAIFAAGGQVFLNNATITNQTGKGDGGVIHLTGGGLQMTNGSTFSNNSTDGNGPIYAIGSAILFDGLTAANNQAESAGLLYAVGGQLTINNSQITQNEALDGDGGAVIFANGPVQISNSTFRQNKALEGDGGALLVAQGTVTINGATFEQNVVGDEAETEGFRRGGALAVLTSTLTINNSTWQNNTSGDHGGAIYGLGSTLSGGGGSFINNRTVISGSGGAIFWEGNPLALNSTVTFQNNRTAIEPETLANPRTGVERNPLQAQIQEAFTPKWLSMEELAARGWVKDGRVEVTPEMVGGAAGMALGNVMAALQHPLPVDVGHLSVAVEDRSIMGPMARAVAATTVITTEVITRSGGAIYSRNADLTLTNPSFSNNEAEFAGGAVYAEGGSLTVTGGNFSGNRAYLSPGGGLYASKMNGEVKGTTFANNRSANGGGAYALNSDLLFENTTVRGNHAYIDGGGLYLFGGSYTVQGSTVEQNSGDRGAGLYFNSKEAVIITGNTIQDNTSTAVRADLTGSQTGVGAGVYVSGTKELSFTHNIVLRNTIPFTQYDRVIKILDEPLIINSVDPPILKCMFPTDPTCKVTEPVIVADNGGGLYTIDTDGIIANSIFRENQASRSGGALLLNGGKLTIVNNLMVRNTIMVSVGLGSAVYISGTHASFIHNTIADNTHQHVTGEGINAALYYADKGNKLTLKNNIFANHEIGVAGSDGAQATEENNVWWNHSARHWSEELFETMEPIFGNPAFKDAAGGDYRITRQSAGYNRGVDVTDLAAGFGGVDLVGENRLQPVDVGAYEENYTRGLNLFQSATELNLSEGLTTTYVITVINNSKSAISDISLQNALPSQQQALAINSSQGNCNLGSLSCNVGTLNIGQQATVSILARTMVAPTPGQIVEMKSVATVNFPGLDANDSDRASELTTYLQALVLGDLAQARDGEPTYTGACGVKLVTEERGTVFLSSVQDAVNRVLLGTDQILVSGTCLGTVNLAVNKNMMIQGGWSTDFKAHDPVKYPTTLRATSGRVVSVALAGIEPRIYDVKLTGGNAPRGGGIYVLEASPVFSNVIVSGNTANTNGGGIYIDLGSKPSFYDSTIESNSANVSGAGVYINQGGGKFEKTIVRNNTGATDGGGFYFKGSDAEVASSEIRNHNVSGYGGGIYMTASRPQIRSTLISNNVASSSGGGVFALKSPATLQFNRITDNRTSAGAMNFIPFLFDLALVEKRGGGGGIYAESSDIRILNNYIAKNRAGASSGHAGAGIHMWLFNAPEISGNMIVDNPGNGVYLRQNRSIFKFFLLLPPLMPPPFSPEIILPLATPPAVKLYHNTIVNNSGSGIYAYSQTNIDLLNNLISGNSGDGVKIGEEIIPHLIVVIIPGFGFFIPIPIIYPTFYPPKAEIAFTFETRSPAPSLQGAWQTSGRSLICPMGEDTTFPPAACRIYHIKRISKAFQMAKASSVGQDIDQEERKQGQEADIGADEYTFRRTRYATVGGTDAASDHLCLNWKTPCTLQTAIDTAEDGDLIKVAGYNDGRAYSTIIDRDGHKTVAIVRKNITIQGGYCETTTAQSGVMDCDWEYPHPDRYRTILDAKGGGRGLTISTSKTMEIFDIHITGGVAEVGGGLYVISSTAVLSHVNIYNNNATHGGGAYFVSSKAIMNESRIANNTAKQGGGLYLAQNSEITFQTSIVEDNNATEDGGAVYANGSKSRLLNNTLRRNKAVQSGGAFYLLNSEVMIEQNQVEASEAPLGGAFYLGPGEPKITGNTITLNKAAINGGGFYLNGAAGVIEKNTVSNNAALGQTEQSGQGGGFYATNTKANIAQNKVLNNQARTGAGLHLFAASDAIVTGNEVTDNIATGNGGGFYLDSSSATLGGNTVARNRAINGGGIFFINFSAASLENNQILSNVASEDGGGLYMRLSNASLISTTITANTGRAGAGLFSKLSKLTIERAHVERNVGTSLGGGFYLDESDSSIVSSAFYTNSTPLDGGALYILRSGAAKVLTANFSGNSAGGNGGAVYINDSNIELKGRSLLNNTAGGKGGGLYADKSDIKLGQFLIRGNQAQNGAGVFLSNGSDAEMGANAFVDNISANRGGAFYTEGSSPTLAQTTIARNTGSDAVYIDTFGPVISKVSFLNTIIADQPVAIRITEKNSATLQVTLWHNVANYWVGPVQVYTGTKEIFDDPRFDVDGYHLLKNSPAINEGDPTTVSEDIDGNAVPQSADPDIGADEFPVPCVAQIASNPNRTYTDLQEVVDDAQPGELIKIAGTCRDVFERNGTRQVVRVEKNVHIQGGYSPDDWSASYPTQTTFIEPGASGRALFITGNVQPLIESVTIRSGKGLGLGGGPDGQDAGGNLYVVEASPTFSNTVIEGGSGVIYGGAGYLIRSSATFITSTVQDNNGTAGAGFFLNESTATFIDNVFVRNGASKDGGAFFLSNSAATIRSNQIDENVAATAGGAIFLDASSAIIEGNRFTKNRAGSAGAIYLDFSPAQIVGNRFEENGAESAGAVMIANSEAIFDSNFLLRNSALNGGGVYVESSAPQIVNNMIVSNTVTSSGSGVYVLSGSPQMLHNTFLYNGGGDGSAISIAAVGDKQSAVTLLNNIIAYHELGVFVQANSSASANATLWFENKTNFGTAPDNPNGFSEGAVKLTSNPRFVDESKLDFRLNSDSPAIDVALPSPVNRDFEGHPRPTDKAADIGADEYYYPDMRIQALTAPSPLVAGNNGIFTFQVINVGNVPLRAVVTGTIPAGVSPDNMQTWTVTIPVGQTWSDSMQRLIPESQTEDIQYSINVVAVEGPRAAITNTVKVTPPNRTLKVTVKRETEKVLMGQPVPYALTVENQGNQMNTVAITATVNGDSGAPLLTDGLSLAPGERWQNTVVVTPTADATELNFRLEVRGSDGTTVVEEDKSTVGRANLSLGQQIQPDPPVMGQPFTITVVITNTGDVAQQMALTVTLEPDFLGQPVTVQKSVRPGETATQVVGIEANSYVGPLTSTVTLVTDAGIRIEESMGATADFATLEPTIVAVNDGDWDDPNTWQPARVPNADDVVLIPEGRTVQSTGPVVVKSLDNRGTLLGPPDGALSIAASEEIQNTGLIQGADGADGNGTGNGAGGAGQGVTLKAQTVHNEGEIKGGKGGKATQGRGGDGGSVTIEADLISNMGNIEAGAGGNGADGGGPNDANADGGNGGAVNLKLTSPKGEMISEGKIRGGSGGNGGAGGGPNKGGRGGAGGSVTITGPGGRVAGDAGAGEGDNDGGGDIIIVGAVEGGNGGDGPGGGGDGPGGGDGGGVRLDVGAANAQAKESGGLVLVVADASIKGGKGGALTGNGAGDPTRAGKGGNGGAVQVAAQEIANYGEILGGDGGNITGDGSAQAADEKSKGGKGGDVTLVAGQGGPGLLDNTGDGSDKNGKIKGGNGGSAASNATKPQDGGDGGNVTLLASPVLVIEDGIVVGGEGGSGAAGGSNGQDGNVSISGGDGNQVQDPVIIIFGEDTEISGEDVTIFGGDGLYLQISGLSLGAIHVKGTFILAVGAGGGIDLTDNASGVFLLVGGKFEIYVNGANLLLDTGMTLEQLADGVKAVMRGSRILYSVRIVAPPVMLVRPGEQVIIPVLVTNLSPVADAYKLVRSASVRSQSGGAGTMWAMTDLPSTVAINGSTAGRTTLTVTVPFDAPPGSSQFVTISAQSFSDGQVSDIVVTELIVYGVGIRPIFLPLVSKLVTVATHQAPLSVPQLYLPMISQEQALNTQAADMDSPSSAEILEPESEQP
ncbi:MAG: right-handed parallel beta-helix repeat-containing protein [Caldilineaceae bacterium]|nr:right-handed parallel beta-helix repeat-containing protein [Caldilineaceae bacterium]